VNTSKAADEREREAKKERPSDFADGESEVNKKALFLVASIQDV